MTMMNNIADYTIIHIIEGELVIVLLLMSMALVKYLGRK